jgi:cell wall-associated NlpC family hydrolase
MRRTAITGLAATALLVPAAPALAKPEPILAEGMQHPAVKRVQRALGVVPRSGYFGPLTLAAVTEYQASHGIPATGVVGPLTWSSLHTTNTASLPKKPARAKAGPTVTAPGAGKKSKRLKETERAARAKASASTLQMGDRGAAVLFLQEQLAVQPQTGYYGPITASFVRALQTAAGLPATGVTDAKTWRKVGKVSFTAPAAPAVTTPAPAPAPPTPAPAPAAPASATAAKVLEVAASLAGVPYNLHGHTPEEGFSCSSYTQWVFEKVGIDLGGSYTVWQYDKARKISASAALPGDLVFFYNYDNGFIGHVGIYAGNGMMWHSPRTGRVVSLEKVYTDKVYYARVLNQ